MEEMRKDPKWVLSLAKAADGGSQEGWCKGEKGAAHKLGLLLKALASTGLCHSVLLSLIGLNAASHLRG